MSKLHAVLSSHWSRIWGPGELDLLQRGVSRRLKLVDRLLKIQRSDEEIYGLLRVLCPIHRKLESELIDYQDALDELVANQDAFELEEFRRRLGSLAASALVISLLVGMVRDKDELIENVLYQAALTILELGPLAELSEGQRARLEEALDIMDNRQAHLDNAALEEQIELAQESELPDDLFAGLYLDRPGALAERIALWVGTALGMYAVGQLLRPDNPYYTWVRDPIKDSCEDCLRLDGQTHTKEEWALSGWSPQSLVLACRGFRCGCQYVEGKGPSQGSF